MLYKDGKVGFFCCEWSHFRDIPFLSKRIPYTIMSKDHKDFSDLQFKSIKGGTQHEFALFNSGGNARAPAYGHY